MLRPTGSVPAPAQVLGQGSHGPQRGCGPRGPWCPVFRAGSGQIPKHHNLPPMSTAQGHCHTMESTLTPHTEESEGHSVEWEQLPGPPPPHQTHTLWRRDGDRGGGGRGGYGLLGKLWPFS